MNPAWWVSMLALATAFAGCSDGGGGRVDEVVITSEIPVQEVESGSSAQEEIADAPKKGTRGHFAGTVINEAYFPVEGAIVRLPGLDLQETTDRNGAFAFADLYPGPYLVRINATGYYGAETVIHVEPDEFTRAKVVLTARPPPEPRHVTLAFDGFADVTGGPGFELIYFSCTCDFYVPLEEGLQTLVVEATMDEYSGAATGSNSFDYYAYGSGSYYSDSVAQGSLGNPMMLRLQPGQLANMTDISLRIEPQAFPLPEAQKPFRVFVTAFYNAPAPDGWSFVAGDE